MSARELPVVIGVVLIIVMLVIPLPSWLLSILIMINISLALLVLLVSMNMKEPLELSVFPSLLLVLTLFRLGLNVSTTRSILGTGEAGGVVETFGHFVIGGNPLVGFVVFIILIIIQFLVITKGAERVSEVAARFTLDAMPGKQMSIDADLNAGMISEKQAIDRREKIQREADFTEQWMELVNSSKVMPLQGLSLPLLTSCLELLSACCKWECPSLKHPKRLLC